MFPINELWLVIRIHVTWTIQSECFIPPFHYLLVYIIGSRLDGGGRKVTIWLECLPPFVSVNFSFVFARLRLWAHFLPTYLPRSHNNPSFISSYHSSVNLFLLVSLPPSLSLSFCLFLSSYFGSQSVWPDFAKFRHFSKIKKSWAIFGGMIWYLVNFLTCFGKHHMLLGPF